MARVPRILPPGTLRRLRLKWFALGVLLSGGAVLICQPELIRRVADVGPWLSVAIGAILLGLVALYVLGSWRQFKPWTWGKLRVEYPRLGIVARQLVAGGAPHAWLNTAHCSPRSDGSISELPFAK